MYAHDKGWWDTYKRDVLATFAGKRYSANRLHDVEQVTLDAHRNSGAGSIALAAHMGAKRVVLLGYDCQHTGGKAHWHGDHPSHLGNASATDQWIESFGQLAARLKCEVLNATRETALTCWPRVDLEKALSEPTA